MTLVGPVLDVSEAQGSPWLWFEWTFHVLAFVLVCYHCLKSRREATSTLLWIFVAWTFPLLGPFAYVCFGIDRVPDKAFKKHVKDQKLLAARKAREDEALPLAYWQSVHETVASEPPPGLGPEAPAASCPAS